jgi:hypothetical protein
MRSANGAAGERVLRVSSLENRSGILKIYNFRLKNLDLMIS